MKLDSLDFGIAGNLPEELNGVNFCAKPNNQCFNFVNNTDYNIKCQRCPVGFFNNGNMHCFPFMKNSNKTEDINQELIKLYNI